jgi:hypothetical protein
MISEAFVTIHSTLIDKATAVEYHDPQDIPGHGKVTNIYAKRTHATPTRKASEAQPERGEGRFHRRAAAGHEPGGIRQCHRGAG